MGIMDYFPYPVPRAGQTQVLTQIEENWDKADVFVICVPTSGGKTALSVAIMRWVNATKKLKTSYSAPTNILVHQFEEAFPKTFALHRKAHYTCIHPRPMADNCGECQLLQEKRCPQSPYLRAVRRAHAVPWLISNTYTYLAHKLYRPVVIFDEAHNLTHIAKERAATHFWHREYDFPHGVRNYGQLLEWLKGLGDSLSPKLKLLKEQVDVHPPKYLIQKTLAPLRGKEQLCLRMIPVDVRDKCGFLWPGVGKRGKPLKNSVQKIILMSATISPQDICDLGLDDRKVLYLETASPIPISRRPVHLLSLIHI